jgi:hypothetical protein
MTIQTINRIGTALFWALVSGGALAYDAARNVYGN